MHAEDTNRHGQKGSKEH